MIILTHTRKIFNSQNEPIILSAIKNCKTPNKTIASIKVIISFFLREFTFNTYTFSLVFLPKIPDGLNNNTNINIAKAAASRNVEDIKPDTKASITPKTSAQKTTPITEEQKEYKTLIAQANAVKNNIGRTEPKQIQKTEVTVNKASTPVAQKSTIAPNKELSNSNKGVKKQSTAPKITLTEVNPQSVKENKDRQTRRAQLAELIQEVKQEKIVEQVPEKTLTTTKNATVKRTNAKLNIAKKAASTKVSMHPTHSIC